MSMNDIVKYLQHCEVTWKYQSFLVGKLICAGDIAMVYCLLKIDACAKVQLGACETKDVIHKSPLTPSGHISEGVASMFQYSSWKKRNSNSRNSSDLHIIDVIINQLIENTQNN